MMARLVGLTICALLAATPALAAPDTTPHQIRMVPVDKDVSLEVVDWGGNGLPLIFLAGLGETAHEFDDFAPKFTGSHHVYGITRRGFGASSAPPPTDKNYDADRLGDDVVSVMDALNLKRPILVGHSIAGEELSSVASRYPQKVTGLIYLDATYAEAFYDPTKTWDAWVDSALVRRKLAELTNAPPSRARKIVQDLQTLLPHLRRSLQNALAEYEGRPDWPVEPETDQNGIPWAIIRNDRQYSDIKPPALVIAASPHKCSNNCDSPGVKRREENWAKQLKVVQAGFHSAHMVLLPNADHHLFRSNEAQVEQEMNAFMDGLK